MLAIVFNPTARGDQARRRHAQLATVARHARLEPTQHAGHARTLAADLVRAGYETIVAAGGDGTVNEVLNGIVDAPGGFDRARLAVLPWGTVNVFAKELGLPTDFAGAWSVIQRGAERILDLPLAEFGPPGARSRRAFAQMAGAGLDSRAISLVNWELKKKFGPLAYVWACGLAMRGPRPRVTARVGDRTLTGEIVALGNGRYLGGRYPVFPHARLDDGALEVALIPRLTWLAVARIVPALLRDDFARCRDVIHLRGERIFLTSPDPVPLHLEGDNVGELPAEFSVRPQGLRVVVPPA
jgi:YegS/Rv2252/BmrU family lipid kinase